MGSSIENRLFFLFLICFLLSISSAWAQTGTTSLHGKVLDSTRAVVEGAGVTLANQAQGFSRRATTPTAGEFEFLALPPGTYVLTVEKAGFKKYEQTNLQLLVNVPTSVNVVLQVGAPTTQIEVSGQAPVINTEDASMGIAFGENQVKDLPLEGRNVPDLLTLQPGVAYTGNRADTSTDDTRSGAVNGARSDQGNVSVDGIRVNDEGGHAFTSVLPVTLDSVQEFRVTTSNANADEGGTSGAQVALVTKSGANNFHGSVYEYLRNTYTSANDYFNKRTELTNCTLPNPNDCNKPPKLIRNIFGASIGGPIKKDRLFFFMNYEGTRRAEGTVSAGEEVPSLSMRDGVLFYQCDHTSKTVATDCPGGFVTGQSQTKYPIPAPVTVPTANGPVIVAYNALSPQQLTQIDPLQAGPDAAAMAYFQSLPAPNSSATGDGFNYQGFVFASPTHETQNVYIARVDYNITQDGKQRLSVMGALRNDSSDACGGCQPYFPGQLPQGQTVYYNKGLIGSYSAVIRPNLMSNFHYGFVRESFGTLGNSYQPWITFNFSQGITRTRNFQRPTHNFSEDLSWIHGKHTLQFGGYLLFMRNPRFDYTSSFDSGNTNSSFTTTSGFSSPGNSSQLNPANNGYPGVDQSFDVSYDYPITDLLGMVTQATTVFNYNRQLQLLPANSPISRRFAQDSYEPYVQDVWKIRSNLTLTLGLRYSLFSPVWETNGLQVCPSPSLGQFFSARVKAGASGIPSSQDPSLQVDWCGPANGKKGFWNWDFGNIGPHVAFAWAPNRTEGFLSKLLGSGNKSSIRGGFGMVYDRFGQGIVDEFNGNSFGLTTTLSNRILPLTSLPRLTNVNVIPPSLLQSAPTAPSFPEMIPTMQTLNSNSFGNSLDTSLKTPYSYTLDFSVERDLGAGFSLDLAYVGRLSHRLLSSQDVAQPLNLRDKKSGLDYFSAIQPLAKLYEQQGVNDTSFSDSMVSPAVVGYWTNMLQAPSNGGAYALAVQNGGCRDVNSPTQTTDPVLAIFDLFCGNAGVETTALQILDFPFGAPNGTGGLAEADPSCGQPGHPPLCQYFPVGGPNSFYNQQYVSLFAQRSIGFSNYNALQATLRHQMSPGIQFDFNYTYSKSIDLCSGAERIGNSGSLNFNGGCQIFNAWSPNLFRAVSDFDTTHQLNANFIVDLPFGRGRPIAALVNRAVDAVIGGWQLSGLFRWTSGFPYTIYNNPADYPTDWYWEGAAMPTVSHVKSGAYHLAKGVNLFPDPTTAQTLFSPALPGQVGVRNFVRGDGFFGLDLGLSKHWKMPWNEHHNLALRWEVFNVTNSARFDFNDQNSSSPSESNNSIAVPNFGYYTHLMTNPRVMQFALRYEF